MDAQELASIIINQSTADNPVRYASIIKASKSDDINQLRELLPAMREQLDKYERITKQAKEFRKQVSGEGYAKRRKDAKKMFDGLDKQSEAISSSGSIDISMIVASHYESITNLYSALVQGSELLSSSKMVSFDESFSNWANQINASTSELGEERVRALYSTLSSESNDALKSLAIEQQLNKGATSAFLQGLSIMERIPKLYEQYLQSQAKNFEHYYERLRHRHSNGMIICNHGDVPSPTLTDVALLIWENLDKVGEIESGHSKDELSAYTVHRANAIVEAAKYDEIWNWITVPGQQMLKWASVALPTIESVIRLLIKIKQVLGESTWKLQSLDMKKTYRDFEDVIESLDVSQITQRPPERAFSKTEKFALDHQNKSIQTVANLLCLGGSIKEVSDEILKLKVEERNFFVLENSFYVCRIGTGNMFTGESPGAIEIIPGEKPHVNLDNIWGSGFDDVRVFIQGMDEAKKWSPLFLATSPSKSTDKANVLLVGPAGCGKTEILRALSSDQDSISIFAVGSDFLTCWLGEAQKNPKRLFDEAIKLHKASGRPVYILIDEIDMVLNDDQSTSKINLSLEFQNLMDGVVAYPGISIWGATNHPKRIPTPMLRRFAKVMVVGELSQDDAVSVLKYYIETFLPTDSISEDDYIDWAKRLEGATGDVLRKVVDEVWLNLMRGFISSHREAAENILGFITGKFGPTFEVSDLKIEDREIIKQMIGETGTKVTPDIISEYIEKTLNNFAVQQQIRVAKDTYRNAKLLLARQKAGEIGVGF
jgi:ATPase family associated with various cellular activities (AAA)